MVLFLTIPDVLIGLFVDPADPERPAILAVGATLLAMAALFQLVDSGQVMALGMLRGVQDTRVPMVMAIVSYWVDWSAGQLPVLGFTCRRAWQGRGHLAGADGWPGVCLSG